MDRWGKDYLDLVEEAHLTFEGSTDGNIAFGTIEGSLDVIFVAREQSAGRYFPGRGRMAPMMSAAAAGQRSGPMAAWPDTFISRMVAFAPLSANVTEFQMELCPCRNEVSEPEPFACARENPGPGVGRERPCRYHLRHLAAPDGLTVFPSVNQALEDQARIT